MPWLAPRACIARGSWRGSGNELLPRMVKNWLSALPKYKPDAPARADHTQRRSNSHCVSEGRFHSTMIQLALRQQGPISLNHDPTPRCPSGVAQRASWNASTPDRHPTENGPDHSASGGPAATVHVDTGFASARSIPYPVLIQSCLEDGATR